MPRPHAPFCVLEPGRIGHGLFCLSRPVARPVTGSTEQSKPVTLTVEVAVRWSALDSPRLVRLVTAPRTVEGRTVVLMQPGAVRELAAALIRAAGHAERPDPS